MREESVYDPNFSLQVGKSRRVTQTANFLSGAGNDSVWQQNWDLSMDIENNSLPGRQQSYGGLQQFQNRLFLSRTCSPVQIGAQPLPYPATPQGFGHRFGKSMIKVANLNFKISESQFKNRVMDIIYQIQNIYWNIYFQREDLEARETSLKAAENLLRDFKIRIDAGTLAPIEIYQAEATVAERKQDLIVVWDLLKDPG